MYRHSRDREQKVNQTRLSKYPLIKKEKTQGSFTFLKKYSR
ncbi:hypothetical protein LEP1GSC062_1246 [Leptospira alexanderi serovar Manhao 3 str. L 60]|uniref:Uncharacterized protein n=1 Tax=Leptospira alexanderi serovar Manhao 3 str. L 60 TaxID=1049759 RepID=V6IAT2_9LEPT|nr:hypothetical protein LEP1GSC062_1246 [Leptospira alexanderi serovar Manhao 3 str. L 60]